MTKSIMIQGAGSNVGKSMIVAGLCRAFRNQGLRVAPFKPQNMSNPIVDMNPVLLKPETDVGSQVVVQGKRLTTVKARDYSALKPTLMPKVLESFERLKQHADLVIVEGAGSPAEINLRDGDIANMGFAQAANVPVVLVGDIDRGGVIAQLVGTHAVLPQDDLARIKAFMINKFRGDVSLFDEGLVEIANRTGWSSLGVLPWFTDAGLLPAEDASDISPRSQGSGFKIAVPQLSRIANFDDLDPLSADPNIYVQMISTGQPLPLDADLILIPGSKSTVGDLAFFRKQGWDVDLAAYVRAGGHVLGICGGYQMLGREIIDADGIEGTPGTHAGLGHLDIVTHMKSQKTLAQVSGTDLDGHQVTGYEIHIGQTSGPDCDRAWLTIEGAPSGASSINGRVRGCYIHGLFSADAFRNSFLQSVGAPSSGLNYADTVERTIDALAAHMEQHCDLERRAALLGSIGEFYGLQNTQTRLAFLLGRCG